MEEIPGPVFELGLGNGRTFDHIRTLLPERKILVFDKKSTLGLKPRPVAENLIIGDVRKTLPEHLAEQSQRAVLIHNDLGNGTEEEGVEMCEWLSPLVEQSAAPGCVVVTNSALQLNGWRQITIPEPHAWNRYFIYQKPHSA